MINIIPLTIEETIVFIGRKSEMEYLGSRWQSPHAELIVLYGRRRVGKTELLRQFAHGKNSVFYACTECSDREQRMRFSTQLLSTGMPAARYVDQFTDWEQAFGSICELPGEGKKLIIIDEFPYMCKGNSAIPSILQHLWDTELQHRQVMIVLCGSSMSFIERELLAEKNPLYGRATGIYRLEPLSFAEIRQFFPNYSFDEQLTAYAVLGGIPHYLRQFDPNISPAENIVQQILSRGSVLFSEVEFLLHQELRETSIYNAIIEAVAAGACTLNLIHGRTQIENTKISAYLRNLMELNVIRREFSILTPPKQTAGSSRGLYALTDAYFKFWYRFVYPNFSELVVGDTAGIYRHQIAPHLPTFAASAFEQICIDYLRRLNQEEALPFHFTKIGRWWEKVTYEGVRGKRTVPEEIDIVAADSTMKEFLLAECKYRRSGADVDVGRNLKEKFPIDRYPGTRHYVVFSFYGFSVRLRAYAEAEGIMLVNGAQMAKVLTASNRSS